MARWVLGSVLRECNSGTETICLPRPALRTLPAITARASATVDLEMDGVQRSGVKAGAAPAGDSSNSAGRSLPICRRAFAVRDSGVAEDPLSGRVCAALVESSSSDAKLVL